ncbi:MAG TPA: hypothetical protein VEQ63_01250 [Bryobacteraceae bacterium]|nr:hypothetical protein [Bryobacteraceae bacterium]
MSHDAVDLGNLPVSAEEAQAELEIVLRSPIFDRSERLHKFLRYICELTLRGESSRINEYLIGSEVFLKGAEYNPNEDSIVRRQAHALRKKLHEYYEGEGRSRPIRIELPVGRYVPAFRRVELAPAGPSEPVDVSAVAPVPAVSLPAPPPIERRSPVKWWVLAVAGAALFAVGMAVGSLRSAEGGAPKMLGPAAEEIWRAWLGSPREAVICLSNPDAAVIKRLDQAPGPEYRPLRFPMHPSEDAVVREALKLPPGGKIYFTPATNMAKMGEAVAGVFLSRFLTIAGTPVSVAQSRVLDWEDLRLQNAIVLGNNESNKWIDPLLNKYPFRLASTAPHEPRGIVNSRPLRGEASVYRIAYSGDENDADEEYALVSMLPGVEPDRQLLLIDGLNMQATQGATEYMTTETTLQELVTRLRTLDPKHTGPWRFQAVLKTKVYKQVPTRANVVTVRVLK